MEPADGSREVERAHLAVEQEDFEALRDLLDAGVDVHAEETDGFTLLHHAIDVEIEGMTQGGEIHVDMTAYLLARGADPTRASHGGRGLSAEHMAFVGGHWVAATLFTAWRRERGRGEIGS